MLNLVDLTDRRILVAGASSGIGRATAILLSQLGAKVILVARRENLLQEVMGQLEGDGHSYYPADLSNLDEIGSLVKKIVDEQGKMDGLVYAAGISYDWPLNTCTPEKAQRMFTINYHAFIEMVRQTSKKNRFNPGFRIVGISSIAAFKSGKAQILYTGTKAAMNASIRCMAGELAEKGICINAVAPGMTETNMYKEYLDRQGGETSSSNLTLLRNQYLGLIDPNDIAKSICFLISSSARFITGITLIVGGGFTN